MKWLLLLLGLKVKDFVYMGLVNYSGQGRNEFGS